MEIIKSLKTPPSRAEFISAIHSFKKKHQVKLKDLLGNRDAVDSWDEDIMVPKKFSIDARIALLREEFFKDPIIKEYLARDSKFVHFSENRPALISDPQKRDQSDYYECKIYSLLDQASNTEVLPYRAYVLEDDFYERGTSDQTIFRNVQNNARGNCTIGRTGQDVYKIREQADRIELGKYSKNIQKEYDGIQFVLSPNAKEAHSTTIVSVIQKNTFRILASIFINSENSESFYKYIAHRFSTGRGQVIDLGKNPERILSKFKEKMGEKRTFIDKENREGYLLNPSTPIFFTKIPEEKDVIETYESEEIDIIHALTKNEKSERWIYETKGCRHIHLIDASHNLQTTKGDKNCSLYSLNFIQGIADMLGDESIAKKIYDLAEQIDSGTESDKKAAELALKKIFQEDLKPYVPVYYDANGNQKTSDQIKKSHLHQRWDVGSQAMEIEALREKGFFPKGTT